MKTLLILLALAAPAAAEINVADSIDWQTIDSDVVVRGFVTSAKKVKRGFEVSFQIVESIKGGLKQSLQFTTPIDPARWQKDKPDLLLFVDKLESNQYVLHAQRGTNESAFVLGKHRAYTSSFGVLEKPTDVLAAVRTATRASATRSHRVDVPWDSPAMKALWSGSAVWMFVPVDAALEKRALEWVADAKNPSVREAGALALANFRSDKNIAIIKKLLADPAFSTVTETGKPTLKRYLVRVAAHEALAKWQVAHVKPTLEEPMKK
jgi:hypothetical protein